MRYQENYSLLPTSLLRNASSVIDITHLHVKHTLMYYTHSYSSSACNLSNKHFAKKINYFIILSIHEKKKSFQIILNYYVHYIMLKLKILAVLSTMTELFPEAYINIDYVSPHLIEIPTFTFLISLHAKLCMNIPSFPLLFHLYVYCMIFCCCYSGFFTSVNRLPRKYCNTFAM